MIYFVVRSIRILSRNRVCVVTNVFNITGSKKHYFIVMEKLLCSKTNKICCTIPDSLVDIKTIVELYI